MSTPPSELVIERQFDASAELLFDAWINPDRMTHWLCPTGFHVLFAVSDVRIGGAWKTGMRSPEGVEYVMKGTYREISQFDRLSFTHTWEEDMADGHVPGYETLVTIDLLEKDGRTTMTFRQSVFKTIEARDGHAGGWSGAFDNLETFIQDQ